MGQIETGTRVRFKTSGLPDLQIDPPTTPPGDTVSWQRYFGGLPGTVVAADPINGTVMVRGRDADGHPYAVEIDPAQLIVEQEV